MDLQVNPEPSSQWRAYYTLDADSLSTLQWYSDGDPSDGVPNDWIRKDLSGKPVGVWDRNLHEFADPVPSGVDLVDVIMLQQLLRSLPDDYREPVETYIDTVTPEHSRFYQI